MCGGCKNETHHIQVTYDKGGTRYEVCHKCGKLQNATVYDVYFPGGEYTNPNITDRMGRPIVMRSKGHKAKILKDHGWAEAGDRVHGTRRIT